MENNDNNIFENEDIEEQITEHKEIENQVAENVPQSTISFENIHLGQPEKAKTNSGAKVFIALMLIAILLLGCTAVGYFSGKSLNGNNSIINTEIASRPTDAEASVGTEVYNAVNPSVVSISVYNASGTSGSRASGIIYTSDGYILTNDHIYSEVTSPYFLVTTYDGKEYKAEFIAGDSRTDMAVLKINANDLTPAVIGDSDSLQIGESVVALGYSADSSNGSIYTQGTISANGVRVSLSNSSSFTMKMLQIDAAINPGNSGGPIVNMYGQVIGVTSSKIVSEQYDMVGYAIPSVTAKKVADSLIKNGYVEGRGKLGITYTEVNAVTAEINKVPRGITVYSISNDSNLYNKGIEVGNIITHINDVPITKSTVALDIIESTAPGVNMSFTVYSSKKKSSFTVYATLIEDRGSSSYSKDLTYNDDSNQITNPFENNSSNDNSIKDY